MRGGFVVGDYLFRYRVGRGLAPAVLTTMVKTEKYVFPQIDLQIYNVERPQRREQAPALREIQNKINYFKKL